MAERQANQKNSVIDYAIDYYINEDHSLEKSANMANMSISDFLEVLSERGIELIPEIKSDEELFDITNNEIEKDSTKEIVDDIEYDTEHKSNDDFNDTPLFVTEETVSEENKIESDYEEINIPNEDDDIEEPISISDVEIDEDVLVSSVSRMPERSEPLVSETYVNNNVEENLPWYASRQFLIGAIIAGILLFLFLGYILLSLLGVFNKNEEVTPNVPVNNNPSSEVYQYTGKDIEEGRSYAESKGYEIVVIEQYSDTVAKGVIMDSSVEQVDGKEVMTLYVSMGSENKIDGNGQNNGNNQGSEQGNSQGNNQEQNKDDDRETVKMVTISTSLRNAKEADAISTLKNLGLNSTVKYEYNNLILSGQVISTNPSIGTFVKEGSTVTLNVSRGAPSVNDCKNKDLSILQAEVNELNKNGANITLKTTTVKSDKAKNTILSQDKTGNLNTGSVINVEVSSGEDLAKINFVGKTFDELKKWANDHNYTISYTEAYSDTIASGSVVSQSPTNFEGYNGQITAVVSRGRYTFPVNNLIGRDKSYLENEVANANAYGAGLKINYTEQYSEQTAGNIISASKDGNNINAVVSKGLESYPVSSQIGKTVQQVQNSDLCQKFNCTFTRSGDSKDLMPGETRITEHPTGNLKPGQTLNFKYLRGVKEE